MVTGGIYKENAFSVVFVAKGEDIQWRAYSQTSVS